jgi:hypothetical protein
VTTMVRDLDRPPAVGRDPDARRNIFDGAPAIANAPMVTAGNFGWGRLAANQALPKKPSLPERFACEWRSAKNLAAIVTRGQMAVSLVVWLLARIARDLAGKIIAANTAPLRFYILIGHLPAGGIGTLASLGEPPWTIQFPFCHRVVTRLLATSDSGCLCSGGLS